MVLYEKPIQRTKRRSFHAAPESIQLSVRAFYADLFTGFPDLHLEITWRYVSDEAIIVEATLSGTHKNLFNGIPATGRRVQFPLCTIFPFDENDRITAEDPSATRHPNPL
jgi:predicted ester cyclase